MMNLSKLNYSDVNLYTLGQKRESGELNENDFNLLMAIASFRFYRKRSLDENFPQENRSKNKEMAYQAFYEFFSKIYLSSRNLEISQHVINTIDLDLSGKLQGLDKSLRDEMLSRLHIVIKEAQVK